MRTRERRYGVVLSLLLALFIFRVIAQLVQATIPVSFLPPFGAWQSGALPYPYLLGFQVLIILYFGRMVLKFRSGKIKLNPKLALVFLSIGSLYMAVMVFRLVAGLSFAADHSWFGARIPTMFHLVLALFILTLGFFHCTYTDKWVAWVTYPVVVGFVLIAHILLVYNGVDIQLSTYIPVLVAALTITMCEQFFPHRRDWLPNRKDVLNDTIYMVIVQSLLPKFIGFFVSITLLQYFQAQGTLANGLWPQHWPIVSQVLLMLISAEFMRYWVHRLAHNWKPLWQFHAVHHSPHKLYWVNVGRFHPLEKMLQYLFDALPFILLGVSEEVLAGYFVFYAVNGFFQHCNIELRLGYLNYLISGPELHRWHHSMRTEESNNNYGNNLIVWDLVFGSWFLPRRRVVDALGLVNRSYPLGFMGQLKTPFMKGLDKLKP